MDIQLVDFKITVLCAWSDGEFTSFEEGLTMEL